MFALVAIVTGGAVTLSNAAQQPARQGGASGRAQAGRGRASAARPQLGALFSIPAGQSVIMPYPFHIVQGETDILFLYEYGGANRAVHMINHTESPVDSLWGGRTAGGMATRW